MAEGVFALILGIASVAAGVRGLMRGRLLLTPPRGIPYRLGEQELRGTSAKIGSVLAILIGVGLAVYGVTLIRSRR